MRYASPMDIRTLAHDVWAWAWSDGSMPDMTYVGSGYSRKVYRIGDHVLKVNHRSGMNSNWNEIYNFRNLTRPDRYRLLNEANIRIPNMEYFEFCDDGYTSIIVADFIPGERAEWNTDVMSAIEELTGLGDCMGSNVLHWSGSYWLVDLGE